MDLLLEENNPWVMRVKVPKGWAIVREDSEVDDLLSLGIELRGWFASSAKELRDFNVHKDPRNAWQCGTFADLQKSGRYGSDPLFMWVKLDG